MSSTVEKILYQKAALIFEELGFLMPQSDIVENIGNGGAGAFVSFKGAFEGCLLISLSGEIVSRLSSNMLGIDGPVGTQMEEDALREIANVICGNTLPAIYGVKRVFNLDAPEVYTTVQSIPNLSTYHCAGQVTIPFDSGQANISLYVQDNAREAPIQED